MTDEERFRALGKYVERIETRLFIAADILGFTLGVVLGVGAFLWVSAGWLPDFAAYIAAVVAWIVTVAVVRTLVRPRHSDP